MSKSGDFIFTETAGELRFVGDFEGLYQAQADPWGQSGTAEMAHYYDMSRRRMLELIKRAPKHILEVGCGHGHVTDLIKNNFPSCSVVGIDVSKTAVLSAKHKYPLCVFHVCDIADSASARGLDDAPFDVIILNQLLWYILDTLPAVLSNIHSILSAEGQLVISNAFAREQRYGRKIINQFHGAAEYFRNCPHFSLREAHYFDDGEEHQDGHFLLSPL